MYHYYNAETRPNYCKTKILNIRLCKKEFPSITYKNMQEALQQKFQGPISWFEDDKLYIGHLEPEWAYKPIGDEPVCEVGINWATMYFKTKESAEKWEQKCTTRHDPISYNKEADIYYVHYHL